MQDYSDESNENLAYVRKQNSKFNKVKKEYLKW